ncbi:hypothetical protein EV122DRAFT_252344 [Schizophyllum commune]
MRPAEEATGQPCRDYLAHGLKLLREAGFDLRAWAACPTSSRPGTYDYMHICPHGKTATLWYITTNESPEKRDLANNEELVAKAQAALGQTQEGRWYHIDLF